MKYSVTIEETFAQDVIVEAGSVDEAVEIAKRKYLNEEIILEPGERLCTAFFCDDGEKTATIVC